LVPYTKIAFVNTLVVGIKFAADLVEKAPEFQDEIDPIYLTREQRYENALRKTVAMSNYADQIDMTSVAETYYFQK